MPLKFKFSAKQEIPNDLVHLYTERDGAWLLDVEGAVEKARLDEFRTNNLALLKERDELRERFKDIDPEEFRQLTAKAAEVDTLIESRTRAIADGAARQIATLTRERQALHEQLSTIQIDQGVLTAATQRGLHSSAIADITARARANCRLVNGAPAVVAPGSENVRLGSDGVTPMTLEEWVATQVVEAPHLFGPSVGGSAVDNSSGGGAGSQGILKNPFRPETWNLTDQMRLEKTDPQLAARLKAIA
jgi:hypothetical protein